MEKKVRPLNVMLCIFYHYRKEIIRSCLFLIVFTVWPTCSPKTHIRVPRRLGRWLRPDAGTGPAGTAPAKARRDVGSGQRGERADHTAFHRRLRARKGRAEPGGRGSGRATRSRRGGNPREGCETGVGVPGFLGQARPTPRRPTCPAPGQVDETGMELGRRGQD